jgi:hypothetical protein
MQNLLLVLCSSVFAQTPAASGVPATTSEAPATTSEAPATGTSPPVATPPTQLSNDDLVGVTPAPSTQEAARLLERAPSALDNDGDGTPDASDPCPSDATNAVKDGVCADGTPANLPAVNGVPVDSEAPTVNGTQEAPAAPAATLSEEAMQAAEKMPVVYDVEGFLGGPPTEVPPPPAPPPSDTPAPEGGPPTLSADELRAATQVPRFQAIKKAFRPSPNMLPANPRGQVDYTAYTLEWGEVKLGFTNAAVGVLPHVQVGTNPILAGALRIPNANAKVDLTSEGLFDVAAYGSYYSLTRGVLEGEYASVGGMTSFSVPIRSKTGVRGKFLSLHLGGTYNWLDSNGELDFTTIGELVTQRDIEPGTLVATAALRGETVTARAALDLRLNRRDTLLLQASSTVYARSEASDTVERAADFFSLDDALSYDGWVPPTTNYAASVAWHLSWNHLEARLGVGTSSVPGAWLMQTTELSYRFGGKTRRSEARMRREYKKNERLER